MYSHFFKRLLDFFCAFIAMPFVLIVVAIFAPIIYFTDRGPIFYNAQRAGRNGKTFKMFKFRSMYVNAPDLRNADGSTFNAEDDPRVTLIGKIMRKTSIDELPQLLNVLIGDMSFVGPRPTLPGLEYEKYDDVRKKRASVRPGITGYAQAYYRNSITQEEKFRYDCEYVDKISFLLDMRVLIKTFVSVLGHKNIFVEQNTLSHK